MATTHEEFFIDFRPDVPRAHALKSMKPKLVGPYSSYEALTDSWGEPTAWEPPLKIMRRTVTTTPLEDYTPDREAVCGDYPASCNCDDPTTHTGRH